MSVSIYFGIHTQIKIIVNHHQLGSSDQAPNFMNYHIVIMMTYCRQLFLPGNSCSQAPAAAAVKSRDWPELTSLRVPCSDRPRVRPVPASHWSVVSLTGLLLDAALLCTVHIEIDQHGNILSCKYKPQKSVSVCLLFWQTKSDFWLSSYQKENNHNCIFFGMFCWVLQFVFLDMSSFSISQ